MNLPSGVRAAETMTTGSDAVAMAVLRNLSRVITKDDIHHMMRRQNCNGGAG
jgi:hypothetical protein